MGDRALSRPAVFLDRDGVLNESVVRAGMPYPPADLSELRVFDGAPGALERLRDAGYARVVITNQPDVARGTQHREVVEAINDELRRLLAIDAVYVCYHGGAEDCACRKPRPGLLLQAARELDIDLGRSFMIGDRWRDVAAATAAGVRAVFIDYGYAEPKPADPHVATGSIEEAVALILEGN
jgi:D-glycero-D-manno-heptose 1,7-bisphosphate phosphatase